MENIDRIYQQSTILTPNNVKNTGAQRKSWQSTRMLSKCQTFLSHDGLIDDIPYIEERRKTATAS